MATITNEGAIGVHVAKIELSRGKPLLCRHVEPLQGFSVIY